MGCKESKHKAAAGDSFITPSPSKRRSNIDGNNNNSNNVQENPAEKTTNDKCSVQKQQSLKANADSNAKRSSEGAPNVVVKIVKERKNGSKVDEKVKENIVVEVNDDDKLKKENEKEGALEEDRNGEGSPNNVFSSRKDDESVEGIISEGMSGTSAYYTPQKEDASEESLKAEDIVEEKKESVEETKNQEIRGLEEEDANLTEGDLMKKVEASDLVDQNQVKETEVTALPEVNPVEEMKAADRVEENSTKEPEAISVPNEDPVKEVEAVEDHEKEIETADVNEVDSTKETEAANVAEEKLKVVDVAEEKPVKEIEIAGETEGYNPVIEASDVQEEDTVKETETSDASKAEQSSVVQKK